MQKRKSSKRVVVKPKTKPSQSGIVSLQDDQKKQVRNILRILKKKYPVVECALLHKNAYELLAATILSAQCTDARVNKVTPGLFERYPTPEDLALGKQLEIEKIVHSLGFFRAKAASLIGMANGLVDSHDGEVPESLEELIVLPGVGRKTANVVLGTWFGIATGVVVDTHVRRISRLLGLTVKNQPEKIEQDLMEILPRNQWINYSHRLIFLGREICIARRPRCNQCPLLKYCFRSGLPGLDKIR